MLDISAYDNLSNKGFKVKLYKKLVYQTAISVENPILKVNNFL